MLEAYADYDAPTLQDLEQYLRTSDMGWTRVERCPVTGDEMTHSPSRNLIIRGSSFTQMWDLVEASTNRVLRICARPGEALREAQNWPGVRV